MSKISYLDRLTLALGIFKERKEPRKPKKGMVNLYVDKRDKHVKIKDSTGSIIDLAELTGDTNSYNTLNVGDTGKWTIAEDGSDLIFSYDGNEKFRLEA